jgi:energy-coupling factor transporter ATP-binding protein EcfA2
MAKILEFTIDNLAGRTEPYSVVLNRDVNIFYGLNGRGNTTLLKILHSALSTDAELLKDLPFTRAAVKIHLNRHNKSFVRTFTQREHSVITEIPSLEKIGQAPLFGGQVTFSPPTSESYFFDTRLNAVVKAPAWSSEPPEPDVGLTVHRLGFLPISRLYRNVQTPTGTRRLSDQELDSAFARGLQSQWSEYYADISKATAKVQERGLANILGFFLAGGQEESDQSEAPDEKEAYKRISGFLRRQPGFGHLIGTRKEFATLYARKPELRNVVKQIEKIENEIAVISAPRERFRMVLESMFTGSKHLVFSEKEIKVELPEKKEIGLTLLSSGEKQLLFIALNTLVGADHCLLIDEPELSMHVDWQKKLVATLRDLNPNLQLVMATHSPEIMADLSDDKIFAL